MLPYLAKRLAVSMIVLLGLSLLAFFMIRLVPGDTVTAMLGPYYDEAEADALRQRHGLDRPLIVQYALWLGGVLTGDFGRSTTGEPVLTMIGRGLPVTAQLAAMAIGFALLAGLPLGILAAVRKGKAPDHAASVLGLIGISVPSFWLGTLFILLFALVFRWLPPGGYIAPTIDPLDNLRHMILPALALGAAVAAVITRMTRSAMLDVIGQDYIRTALSKGLAPRTVWVRHALKNAMIPILTVAGIQAGYLLGGSVVIEQVFSLPGLGRMALQAIERRDYPLLQGVVLFIGAAFVTINLLVDILYSTLDPRVALHD